jgi:hypothetical protein
MFIRVMAIRPEVFETLIVIRRCGPYAVAQLFAHEPDDVEGAGRGIVFAKVLCSSDHFHEQLGAGLEPDGCSSTISTQVFEAQV